MNTNRYTIGKEVSGTVKVFALPRSEWEIKQAAKEGDDFPFKYVIDTSKPWQDGAVEIMDIPVSAVVPPGIDLLKKTVDTLTEAKDKAKKRYEDEVDKLDEQINQLLLLTDQRPYADREEEAVVANQ